MTGDVVYPPAAHSFVLSAFTVEAVRRECYLVQRKHYDNLVAERDALKARIEAMLNDDWGSLTRERDALRAELDALRARHMDTLPDADRRVVGTLREK